MTIRIQLSAEATRLLRERATALGIDAADYAAQILERDLKMPTIDEIMAPVREEFARSGLTEEQLMDLARSELEAMHEEKLRRREG